MGLEPAQAKDALEVRPVLDYIRLCVLTISSQAVLGIKPQGFCVAGLVFYLLSFILCKTF